MRQRFTCYLSFPSRPNAACDSFPSGSSFLAALLTTSSYAQWKVRRSSGCDCYLSHFCLAQLPHATLAVVQLPRPHATLAEVLSYFPLLQAKKNSTGGPGASRWEWSSLLFPEVCLRKKAGATHTDSSRCLAGGTRAGLRYFSQMVKRRRRSLITWMSRHAQRAHGGSTRREHTRREHTEGAHGGSTRREHTRREHTERAHTEGTHTEGRGHTGGREVATGRVLATATPGHIGWS